MSDADKNQEQQEIAYRLWEEAGCPDNRDEEFWEQAGKEISNRGQDGVNKVIHNPEDAAPPAGKTGTGLNAPKR